ncbi:MAG: amidohydrolase family protein [Pseudomonadota bacterium]|uniref:amidohydrolase family protein n=1 Tax=unclassified Phenylobacterium TaxID=2640670 RepID=UPI0006F728C4|nr:MULTISPECIES: amidohydrolase family protein [unclassified Phenylobacterium]KRB48870.1 hydratase [Phenylobacterium sp. Root700]MBT9473894.1 amidohydrolase [Phenylobacterium sp.]
MHDNCDCCGEGRRKVLRAMLGMASAPLVAAAASSPATAATPARMARASGAGRIDTHAHLWPVEYLDFVEKAGDHITQVARNIRATASPEDLKARFAMMDKAGVAKQVLSATPQLVQSADAKTCLTGARMINDVYAGLVKTYPDRFMAYGAVPLPHVDEAVVEARRCMTELGFRGIALNTLTANKTIATDDYSPFYAELDRLGAVLYIHPTGCGAQSPMINDFRLEWVVGAPFEDSLAVLQLLKADIPHKYPNIKFHVAHLGGALGFLMQRIEDNYAHWKAFPRSPTAELKKMWFDTANFHAPALRCMIETFGSERLILGSDFPYFQDELYTRIVTYVEGAGLPAPVSKAILEDNAHRLYGSVAPA